MAVPSSTRYPRARRVQQREIAERAGVSISTVSRVLNNLPGISLELQHRVREVAADLGYAQPHGEPNNVIRRISLLTRLAPQSRSLDPFHSGILSGIEAECRRQGINLSFMVLEPQSGSGGALLDQALLSETDGLLLLSVDDMLLIQQALVYTPHVVLINAEHPELDIDMILPNNHLGVLRAIRLLIAHGHRRILHYTSLNRRTFHRRLAAYREALGEAGIPYDPGLIINSTLDAEGAHRAIAERLAAVQRDFTAVFCANDVSAMGMMHGLQEAGLHIPEDVSIIGCDDIPGSAFLSPPLTTIRIEREELGALAVRRLVDRAQFPDLTPIRIEMASRLIERRSVGRISE